MSQFQNPITGNTNSFNTTGSLNHNTNALNNNNHCFNTNNTNITVTDDRSEILTWLSPLQPNSRHYDLQTRRVRNVGGWLLRTEEFRSWQVGNGQGESQKATIFCSGNPGVGKTYISSLVIDSLCDEPEVTGKDIVVACVYFDFAAQKEQSATSILGSLLKQVVSGFRPIPKEILNVFQKREKVIGGQRLQLPEVVKLLGSLSSMRRTFFCLDALDECADPERAKILLSLKDIIKISPTTRVFLTGRPHVSGEVGRHLPGEVAVVWISSRKDDIIQYIHAKLAEDAASDEMDARLEAEIVEKLPETVSEIFLLVSLNLDAILQETSIHRRRERLQVMADGLALEDAYGATLGRITTQGGQKCRLGMTALMWICHSERPLGAEELCQALAIEIGATDCNTDNISSIRTVLSCCQGLVIVDKEGWNVRLIHHTLQEYLTSHRNIFPSPHSTIAETCLTYLNSQQVMALWGSPLHNTQSSSFLEYSSLYWGAHMKKELTDRGKMLALKLFSRYECHISIRLLLQHTLGRYAFNSIVNFYKFTGLHCSSIFGLVGVVRPLAMMDGVDLNGIDETGATPLLWAARIGQGGVVELLLGREDVDPNRPDGRGRTPISWAAENGHEEVVKLLLGREDINPDRLDDSRQTPMLWAAGNGHGVVVKLLLERKDVNPNRPDDLGQTPISQAAENGHEAVVKILLEREDVNPDRPDRWGQTPISWAAENGHEAAVKLLLGREGVNPDRSDDSRQTPILWAAGNGHGAVVKLLLGQKVVNPNRPDDLGQTPISRAAENGHEAVVKLLLEREDVNPNRPDDLGQTPISRAAENGHEAVAKLLQEREDINPDPPDI